MAWEIECCVVHLRQEEEEKEKESTGLVKVVTSRSITRHSFEREQDLREEWGEKTIQVTRWHVNQLKDGERDKESKLTFLIEKVFPVATREYYASRYVAK